MLKNPPNRLQAQPGIPQPLPGIPAGCSMPAGLQWADCHLPHVDTPHPGTRSHAQRQPDTANSADATPDSADSAGSASQHTPPPLQR